MEARPAGEENRREGENRGKGKKKCGEGRRGEGRRVFRKVRSRRWECRFQKSPETDVGGAGFGVFKKMEKPALVVPALQILKNWRNRRWCCRLYKLKIS